MGGPESAPSVSVFPRFHERWNRTLRRAGGLVRANPGVSLTLAGLFAYSYLRFIYILFYGPLGIRPEDVGYGYAEVLAQSTLGVAVVLLVTVALVLSVPYAAVSVRIVLWTIVRRPLSPNQRRVISSIGIVASLASAYFLLVGSVALGFWLSMANLVAQSLARLPKRRDASVGDIWREATTRDVDFVRPVGLLMALVVLVGLAAATAARSRELRLGVDDGRFPPLLVDAHLNQARWLGREATDPFESDECLFYLGASDGLTVLFRPDGDALLRLPTSNVAVWTGDCQSES